MAVAEGFDQVAFDCNQIAAILGLNEDFAERRGAKERVHGGGVGDEDFIFGVAFTAAAIFDGADNAEVEALDFYEFSDGVCLFEEFFGGRFCKDGDVGVAIDVVVAEHDAAVDLIIGDQKESGRDAQGFGGGVMVAIFGLDTAIN